MRAKHVLVLAAIALVLPFAAACSAADKLTAVEIVHAAASKSTGSGTVSFEMSMTMSGSSELKSLGFDSIKETGAIDFNAKRMNASMGILGMNMDVVIDETTMYMRASILGPKWYKQDVAKLGNAGDPFGSASDPSQGLNMLTGVAPDMHAVGSDDIRGVHATHYAGTVDLQKALDDKGVGDLGKTFGLSTMPVDVWIDSDGRVVRLAETLDFGGMKDAPSELAGVKETVSMDYFDYGKPVDIQVPAPDQVSDGGLFDGLINGLGDKNP